MVASDPAGSRIESRVFSPVTSHDSRRENLGEETSTSRENLVKGIERLRGRKTVDTGPARRVALVGQRVKDRGNCPFDRAVSTCLFLIHIGVVEGRRTGLFVDMGFDP